MDKNIAAVLLSCLLYSLYVLLPMIPAVVIYRLFPDTKVAVSGPFASLTIKSTGAFAAYVIVVSLGFFLIRDTHTLIAGMVHPTWTVNATLELQDKDGKKLDDQSLLEFVDVGLTPDIKIKKGNFIQLKLPSEGIRKPEYYITFKIPQFGEKTINTAQLKSSEMEEYTFDKVLNIDPISIQEKPPYPKEQEYLKPEK